MKYCVNAAFKCLKRRADLRLAQCSLRSRCETAHKYECEGECVKAAIIKFVFANLEATIVLYIYSLWKKEKK